MRERPSKILTRFCPNVALTNLFCQALFSHGDSSLFETDFDGDGQPDEINFMIKRIKVHTEQALNEASYRFPGNYGVEKFLELFSGTSLPVLQMDG